MQCLNLINKYWKLLVICCFIGLLPGLFICFFATKIYEANTKLLIAQDNMSIMGSSPLEDIMLSSLGKSDPMTTQMEIVQTRPVINQVIDSLNLRDKKNKKINFDKFIKNYKISILRNTNIIEIKCRYHSQDSAALFANIVASVYVAKNKAMNQEAVSSAINFLEQQLINQKIKVESIEKDLINYKKKTNTISLIKETDVNIEAISRIETERIKTESDLIGALDQQKFYKDKLTTPNSQNNPSYSLWFSNYEQLDNLIIGLKGKLNNIQNQISKQQFSMRNMPMTEIKLAQMVREQEVANEIYTGLLEKYQEFKIREIAQIGSAKIIEPAVIPEKPILPKKKITLILSFLSSMCLFLSMIFLLEYLKGSPKSIEEIKNILDFSILGTIPYIKNKMKLFTKHDSMSVQSEAIRLIQTNLKFKNIDKKCKVITITSYQPSEGKSTISSNLAYSLSKTNKVLLLGMDLRKPTLNDIFDIDLKKGMTNILIGENIETTKYDTLDIIGSGSLPPNPLEIVTSEVFHYKIDEFRKIYDIVLIDTAPISIVAETIEIAKLSDSVLLVIDISSISIKNLQSLKNNFCDKFSNVSIIINKFGKQLNNYYSYGENK